MRLLLAERHAHQVRHAHGFLVHYLLGHQAVRAHHLAVIGSEYDDGVLRLPGGFERPENPVVRLVHQGAEPGVIARDTLEPGAGFQIHAFELLHEACASALVPHRLALGRDAGIIGRQRRFLFRVQLVQGARKRRVRLQRIHVEHPGLMAMRQDKLRSFVGQERWLRVLHRRLGNEAATVNAVVVRSVAEPLQKRMIGAAGLVIATRGIVLLVAIFDGLPFLESVLREHFVAQMPFAHVTGAVTGIAQKLRERARIAPQCDVVADTAALVRPPAGHDGRPARRADRLRDVGAIEDHAFRGEAVERGHLEATIAVTAQSVGALLVGPEEQEIGLVAGSARGAENGGRGGGPGQRLESVAAGDHRFIVTGSVID